MVIIRRNFCRSATIVYSFRWTDISNNQNLSQILEVHFYWPVLTKILILYTQMQYNHKHQLSIKYQFLTSKSINLWPLKASTVDLSKLQLLTSQSFNCWPLKVSTVDLCKHQLLTSPNFNCWPLQASTVDLSKLQLLTSQSFNCWPLPLVMV